MPRPRSSTFYLPLAPIDAPLELKAKLSVLPPSAANALLAPRNNSYGQAGAGAGAGTGSGSGSGFSRSGTTTTAGGETPSFTGSDMATGTRYGTTELYNNTPEDECTRLNRVLGIPSSSSHQHTHITLPQQQHHPSSTLNVPPTQPTGRRRHTDAPRPSIPLSRSPRSSPRSPLIPTPIPSERSSTGYFSARVAPADWSVAPTTTTTTTGPATTSQQHQHQPSSSESNTERITRFSSTASIHGNAFIIQSTLANPKAKATNITATNITVKATSTGTVTDKDDNADRVDNKDDDYGYVDDDDDGGVDETEVSRMAWTSEADNNTAEVDNVLGGGFDFEDDVRIVSGGHGAVDMDLFAGACDVQNPVVLGSPTHSPRTLVQPLPAKPLERTSIQPLQFTRPLECTPPPMASPPTASPASTSPASASTAPTRVSLSYIPCGMHHVLACRTKIRSRFAPSPPPPSSSRPLTARSRPSTSTSTTSVSSSTSTCTPASTSTTSSSASTPTIALTSKLAIHPPPNDSLHPNDTRHLLRPQFRLSFPPPPAPLPLAKDTHPREEASMFVDESIPGLADIHARFVAASQGSTSQPSSQHSSSAQPVAKVAPLQRFRLAPLYLPKVLRRSLGATAWARMETLRAARAAEQAFGWAMAVDGTVPPNFTPGTGAWSSAYGNTQDAQGNSVGCFTGGAWWGRVAEQSECGGNSLVWSGYEDVYSEEDVDMQGVEGDEDDGEEVPVTEECLWDWDDEDVEPVLVQGQEQRHRRHGEEMDEDAFVREGAPEPEERPSPTEYSPQSSPSYSIPTPCTPSEPEGAGYSMVGKFGWNTTWPASPTSPISPTAPDNAHFQSISTPHFPSVDIPGLDSPPVTLGLPPVPRRSVRREDGAEEEEEEEEIFRYSPLKVEEDPTFYGEMDVEEQEVDYLHTGSLSSCSTPTATSPSFPPEPLRGIAISSSFDEEYLVDRVGTGAQVPDSQGSYDADGDAEMEEAPSRPSIRAPRPLSLVQHPVLHHQYHEDQPSPPASKVFIIPPSPLTTTTFDTGSGTGSSTPTAAAFPDRMEEEGDLSNVGWPTTPMERSLSPRRSYERIVAPKPQRVSRGMEHVFTASTSSPVYKTSSLAQSPPPRSPPSSSSSPQIPSTSSPRWTFGSLKSALSNSVSHLVELARSRSPSPLPWLMRSSVGYTGSTLSGVAAALEASNASHRRDGSEEDLDSERSTGCVTPTPTAGSHSRRSSTTTITGASSSHLPVLKLQVDNPGADTMMSESPPPKRTLSTSSLSSLGSEPDSESGSSGGIFSRSPSPEPTSDPRIWDPSYTLTPRSRPISADAKAAAACGGRLSPMMIPGSWDPVELWAEEGDLAKTW